MSDCNNGLFNCITPLPMDASGKMSDYEFLCWVSANIKKIWDCINNIPISCSKLVTPQMFGAVGDGITDDSRAFQKAINTGYDVYIPTMNNEKYYIGETLTMNTMRQRLISYGMAASNENMSNRGQIIFNSSLPIGISVTALNVMIYGLSFTQSDTSAHNGTCISVTNVGSIQDGDAIIKNCYFFAFETAVYHMGRGILFENNYVVACDNGIELNFSYTGGTDYSSEENGFRGNRIINNRFHSIATDCVIVNSGIISCIISQNVMDTGRGFITFNTDVHRSIISENIIHFSRGGSIEFNASVTDVTISNNSFFSESDGTTILSSSFIAFEGTDYEMQNVTIQGNTFDGCNYSAILSAINGNNISIIGNTFYNIGLDGGVTRGCAYFPSANGLCFIGNICNPSTAPYAVRFSSGANLENSNIIGNAILCQYVTSAYTDGGNNNVQSKT